MEYPLARRQDRVYRLKNSTELEFKVSKERVEKVSEGEQRPILYRDVVHINIHLKYSL